MEGASVDTRTAQVLGNVGAPLHLRARDLGVQFGKVGLVLALAALNSAFWVAIAALVTKLLHVSISPLALTIFGLVILAISAAALALLMLERR